MDTHYEIEPNSLYTNQRTRIMNTFGKEMKTFRRKLRDVFGCALTVFSNKAVGDELFTRKTTRIIKYTVRFDAILSLPSSMFQPVLTIFLTGRHLNSDIVSLKL